MFSIQRNGYTRVPELFLAIVNDLVANGFTLKFPTSPLQAPVDGTPYTGFKATLEASAEADPLAASQPYRIAFDCSTYVGGQVGNVFIAAPLQLPNDGTVATLDKSDGSGTSQKMFAGMLNTTAKMPTSVSGTTNYSDVFFIYRQDRITDQATANAYPMSYRLSITDHGVAVCVWENATDEDAIPQQSWFVAQRPVDHVTGAPLVDGHCPLFCVYGMKSKVSKFIVRESDVLKPSTSVDATIDTEDSAAIINNVNQVSIRENGRYLITFPNGLNTARHAYTEDLDMIAYTSADVVSQFSDVKIQPYGEAQARTYKAMLANTPYNTGMRILFITDKPAAGGGA